MAVAPGSGAGPGRRALLGLVIQGLTLTYLFWIGLIDDTESEWVVDYFYIQRSKYVQLISFLVSLPKVLSKLFNIFSSLTVVRLGDKISKFVKCN